MPTYRGEQNKFDYLIHFPPCRPAIMLIGKRETDKHAGSTSFVLPDGSLSSQIAISRYVLRNFSSTLSHDVTNTPC